MPKSPESGRGPDPQLATILIAGPTASGKSALALALARHLGGAVVNADSQQVYREWRILTARPGPEDEAEVPHYLYGHVPLSADYSVGKWLTEVRDALTDCARRGLRPVVAGGTGLYFKALTGGLAAIPPVAPEVRARAEADLARFGREGLHARLSERDPETAATLDRANPARLVRAWEVLEATGTGLAEWHRRTESPVLPLDRCIPIALLPPREVLYARANARLEAMVAEGVLDEVARVAAHGLDPELPGMKAVGAPEFLAHLRGDVSLDEALEQAKTATRHYAKRQLTWIRNQMRGWHPLDSVDPATNLAAATRWIAKAG